ncbi:hypothetical protein GCM10011583_55250 [Streptomyces camponoticapitis]|uniref:Hint domain-containing protein n=1 Tax=Streptomyces camponoticapitis TaxID=1616125 RepID=A0ABQ2EPB0_9ACTN|nr:polymorphic toxin-type HINT domain-containing protein [Streptomyces camponoticapitis]GGK16304.1 hypothetical protein GCM10011583_55250 [Streptomyces camponoticapitis]
MIKLPGCRNSFTADTPVLLADGTRKPIKDIQIGDQVLATDPETGESGPRPVTALTKGTGDKQLVDITLDTGRTSTVTATDGHPFWVPALGRCIEADKLTTGQWLQTSTGTWTQITAVTHHTKSTTVYNLTVNDLHTYHVLAGDTPVLVHNCGVYGELDEYGRATGVYATLTRDSIGGTTNPSLNPVGWVGGMGYNRSHLWGAQLGGSNSDRRNFVTMHQYANHPVMRRIENQVRTDRAVYCHPHLCRSCRTWSCEPVSTWRDHSGRWVRRT